MKRKPIVAIIYNFLMALATATLGALVLSWPLLAVFVKVQKTKCVSKNFNWNSNEKLYSTVRLLIIAF